MKLPIINGLNKYAQEIDLRFHMPGHKGKKILLDWNEIIPSIDVTEVEGTDNLHNPNSIILESEKLAAKTFGANETFYSVNGTTAGIYAAICASTNPGDDILIQRDCHKSVYNAAILGRLNIHYIYPRYNSKYNLTLSIDPCDLEDTLKRNDVKAVVITYPSYYGICSDISRISDIVHKYKKILIVDEAHGSHFKFSNKLPITSLEAGADIVIQSTHKTLPAFTQGSMVHVGSDRIDVDRLKLMLSLYQTTSPSYLIMASLDAARAYMESEGKYKLESLINNIQHWTSYLNSLDNVLIVNKDILKEENVYDFDLTKLIIGINKIRGTVLERILRENYSIQLEMSDYYYGLAITTALDEKKDIEKLAYSIENISKLKDYQEEMANIEIIYPQPHIAMPIYEAFYSNSKLVDIKSSVKMVSADFIVPYPPGVPLLNPGEIITSEIVEYIYFLLKNNVQILGLKDYNYNNKYIRVIDSKDKVYF